MPLRATKYALLVLVCLSPALAYAGSSGYPTGTTAGSTLYNYAMYKNNPTVNTTTAADLRTALEAHVTQFITANMWSPFHEFRGASYSALEMIERTDTFQALSLAYPYLSGTATTGLKGQVRTYLRSIWVSQQPYAAVDHADLTLESGTRRNWNYPDPDDYEDARANNPYYPVNPMVSTFTGRIIRLYPIWLFLQNTDSWDLATYSTLKSIYTSISSSLGANDNPNNNRNIASVIAFARIADHYYQASDVTSALTALQTMIASRIDLYRTEAATCSTAISCLRYSFPYDAFHHRGYTQFFDMCPEQGRILKDYDTASNYSTALANMFYVYGQGFWSVMGEEPSDEGEVFAPYYFSTMTFFNFFSYIQQVDFYLHCQMADMAACKADVYYVERLVRAIEASGSQNWVLYSEPMTGFGESPPTPGAPHRPVLMIILGII